MARLIAVDTESHGSNQYSIQVSLGPGTGIIVLIEDTEAVEALVCRINTLLHSGWELVLHNASYDLPILEKLGIDHRGQFRDTLQEAFQLGNLPQGLKALTYRLFRVTMTSWEDTVRPASLNAVLSWLSEAIVVARLDLFSTKTKVYKTCLCGHSEKAHWNVKHLDCSCRAYTPREETLEVPGSAESLFNRLINHTDAASEYDPWERLDAFWQENEAAASHLEARVGKYPILGIGNCTEAQAIRYAVGDADWTGQVAAELEKRRRNSRFEIMEGDEDQ